MVDITERGMVCFRDVETDNFQIGSEFQLRFIIRRFYGKTKLDLKYSRM